MKTLIAMTDAEIVAELEELEDISLRIGSHLRNARDCRMLALWDEQDRRVTMTIELAA